MEWYWFGQFNQEISHWTSKILFLLERRAPHFRISNFLIPEWKRRRPAREEETDKKHSASLRWSGFPFVVKLPPPLGYGTQKPLAFDQSWEETTVPPIISGRTRMGDNRGLQGTFPEHLLLPLLLLLLFEPLKETWAIWGAHCWFRSSKGKMISSAGLTYGKVRKLLKLGQTMYMVVILFQSIFSHTSWISCIFKNFA